VSLNPIIAHVPAEHLRVGALWHDRTSDRDVRHELSEDGLVLAAQARTPERLARAGTALDAVVLVVKRLGALQYAVIHGLRAVLPDAGLVVVSDVVTRRDLQEAQRAGADALVLRSRARSALPSAVRATCAGQFVVPRDLAGKLTRPVLTVRERQVLGMVVLGCTNAEIARRLYVAETTVKSHLSTAFAKLGVRSRSEAVAAILDPDTGLGTGILAISEGELSASSGRPRARVEPDPAIRASGGSR
jgi:DNA-binding NarL/FixJ family response regulator